MPATQHGRTHKPPFQKRAFLPAGKIVSEFYLQATFYFSAAFCCSCMPEITQTTIHACQKGDHKAQKQVFEALYAPLYRVCRRYLNHKEEAEDCLMKGFFKAFQGLDRFRYAGDGSLQSWLRRIVVNECLMALRKKSSLLFSPGEEVVICSLPADVLAKTDAAAIEAMVLQLPVGYRTVFNLFAVEGYSHQEIAGLLGITENTSKSQFSKARLKLKQALQTQKEDSYGKPGK